MSSQIVLLICLMAGLYACQKSDSIGSKKADIFFISKQDAAKSINRFSKQSQTISSDKISSISYIHTTNQSFAFVFYETNEGPRNMVITRTYSPMRVLESEKIATCDGTCGCQVQAIIDNQGKVKVGCSCANCALVYH